ncbi:hypothetical protein [Nocardia blacklockiae]|uniref:hypothetical protein n=1 Tax=Nocardia blacklockiae TaxID=480036 RepID=UPI001895E72A|nr:hypothetical protein [Nocardia blacklockiae]MBF6176775.1 hypothetical protein [Nocardia blacklockiae]
MAKHAAALDERQRELTKLIAHNHADLTKKVDEVTVALKVREAKAGVVRMTPLKGDSFAARVHEYLDSIAAGLGDEYCETGSIVGVIPRSKKGDGLLTTAAGARVVLEMTDSHRKGWIDYLDEAERNRQAAAALGIVRTPEQNGGETIRVLGPRRMVLAFDPDSDDPDLLRASIMLLRAASLMVAARGGSEQLATAQEKIRDAIARLEKLATAKKSADAIRREATKIEKSVTDFVSGVELVLAEAMTALTINAGPTLVASPHTDVA